ncbi:MAG TPA: stimulus-sensing domain-containing protein [Rhizomicrobium sp.]|jgi:two-component system sensor histidine kinase ChvG|nr:stimulus-sensing domain-containing protein [Rhizomicrobium sp.]
MSFLGEPVRRRFSALTRRILLFNIGALLVLIVGVFFVQSSRLGLIDERIAGIKDQASIVAGTLAEYTTVPENRSINPALAEPLMRQLIAPTRLRARLYDTHGRLITDTRNLLARNIVQISDLPPIDRLSQFNEWLNRVYEGIMGVRPFADLDRYFEAEANGRAYSEVRSALTGDIATAERVDNNNKLVLSVAVPIQRFKAVYGVVMVSTESGDIDAVLREQRATLLEVSLLAFGVLVLSSIFLSGTIAEPVHRLAEAADRVRRGRVGRETIPRMDERQDEIGELAASLSAMTQALYDRIDAIESFAADVAHELKNPLTSLKNAVEMLVRAKDDESRLKLMAIVKSDVGRIDRLITDISDASRLDAEMSREEQQPVEIARLLETIVEVYRTTGHAREIALTIDLPTDATAIGRAERFGQIFRNLIDNAISFSPPEGIVRIGAEQRDHFVRVTVDDDGPGIPPDNLETIFNRFYTERSSEQGGFGKNSGLGLSIARQIATGAGGRIWAENREPHGARFVVELPLTA